MAEGKEGYIPAERRFKVSNEEYSRERIEILRNAYKELKVRFPHVRTALSLFGSLSKGKPLTAENVGDTDIDVVCFYDSEDLSKQHAEMMKTDSEYAKWFEQHSHTKAGLPRRAVVASNRAMMETLVSFMGDKLARTGIRQGVEHTILAQPISMNGVDSILRCAMFTETAGATLSSLPDPGRFVARCFHLDVGGGLKPYRQDFLLKLTKLNPADAELYWQIVNHNVRKWERLERHGEVPEKAERQFPATFKDAVAYYGLPQDSKDAI